MGFQLIRRVFCPVLIQFDIILNEDTINMFLSCIIHPIGHRIQLSTIQRLDA